ncbi:MAG TPA: hypothetical protein VF209_03645 [Patescibacteria group bacterium]
MHKAKSRLVREAASSQDVETIARPHRSADKPRLFTRYLKQLPTLIVSLPFGAVVFYILTKIQPDRIAHVPVPHSYLLLLIPFFLFSFWVMTFLLLNARRGFFLSLLLTLFLFFRLQAVIFTWQVVAYSLLFVIFLEVLFTLTKRITYVGASKKST